MIFFAIFIVNSFLNSGFGYVGAGGCVSSDLSGNIGGLICLHLDNGLRSSLRLFLLWGVSLVGLSKWDWSWVWPWLWINEISSICFNLDLSCGVGLGSVSGGRISLGVGFNLSNSSISSLLERDWIWVWIWLRVNEISSVSLGLDGGVGGFDS